MTTVFYKRVSALCKENSITPKRVCKDLYWETSCADDWRKGVVPRGAKLLRIATYFGVSPDYLLGKSDEMFDY